MAMTRKTRRMYFVGLGLLGLFAAAGLMLTAFQDNLVFFRSPSEIVANPPPPTQRLRIGGLVELGSIQKDGERVTFTVDRKSTRLNSSHT